MIEFKLVLRFFVVYWLFFPNSGAQKRCAQIRYTDVKSGLDWPSAVITTFISLLYLYLCILLKLEVIDRTCKKKKNNFPPWISLRFSKISCKWLQIMWMQTQKKGPVESENLSWPDKWNCHKMKRVQSYPIMNKMWNAEFIKLNGN